MWQDFITAFTPFFEYFFSAIDRIVGIFFDDTVVNGVPQGITLFGVPIIVYPLAFMFFYVFFTAIMTKGD